MSTKNAIKRSLEVNRSFTGRKRVRRSFGKIPEVCEMPNLLEVQQVSYEKFLQYETPLSERLDEGMQEVFASIFPIKDFAGRAEIDFVSYEMEDPKYDVDECMQRDLTYAAPLRAVLRLSTFDIDEATGLRSIRDIKEQEVYMVDMPLMTDNGTFIINGTERVIVSQMHRSPGVFFDHDGGKTHSSGKYLFAARVIPYRGSWLDFEFDAKDVLYVRIDRRRKLPVTTFLMALDDVESGKYRARQLKAGKAVDVSRIQGMTPEDILNYFYNTVSYTRSKKGWVTDFVADNYRGIKLKHDLIDASTNRAKVKTGTKVTARQAKKLIEDGLKQVVISEDELCGSFIARNIIDSETGEVIFEAGDELDIKVLAQLEDMGLETIDVLAIDNVNIGPYIRNTLMADKSRSRADALVDIYRIMRPGEPPTLESGDNLLQGLFFDSDRYDLSPVGRVKMNARMDLATDDQVRVLRKDDILNIVKILLDLKDGRGEVDDIDHLGNRRVRSVGELMENQMRMGLMRMERAIKERMGSIDIDTAMPHDLINAKPVAAVVREFFGSSQLSQFMDQTNPLSEITNKRRLSALGPGGLTRERAGFEVRDVHPTHYGRICPIETPEGPNIGLINSLAVYARVNQYGFIETPYRKIIDGKVTNEIVYMSAMEEGRYAIAQANAEIDGEGKFIRELISCRQNSDYVLIPSDQIDLIDVSPKQIMSVATSLIPFLENDDANRALMGSNMMRQAVPLLCADSPLVGTGMESLVARDSGAADTAKRNGVVDQVDANRIVIHATGEKDSNKSTVDIYKMKKFSRSNQSTCINQSPLVKVGDVINEGDIIADGPSTDLGELALGRNVLCAFMPWNGYNYEDSILISERIVRDDVYTSIHIEEFEVMARDTKLGQEEITRDIPNVGEEGLKHLDEAGIVYIGAEVKAGDILVGKVTPKGESPMTPEEKLLRAIFGEKASDVKDTSLRIPPGAVGTVVDVRVFSRRGVEKDQRALSIEREEIERLDKDRKDERRIYERGYYGSVQEVLESQTLASPIEGVSKGEKLTEETLQTIGRHNWRDIVIGDGKVMETVENMTVTFDAAIEGVNKRFENKVDKLQRGDEMLPGVMKMVKVFIAIKRKLQPGDKMAGRHGNKGVVSKIMPVENMPYLEDGTPVDIVLNPLGVPSRMNVGQILETHLGWASAGIGKQIGDILDQMKFANDDASKREELEVNLHERLQTAYGDEVYESDVKTLKQDELMEMCNNVRKGVPMATPVFDGAVEADINKMLKDVGLSVSGQERLIDGRTGEYFDREVTVGYIYILKLHHLVDEKMHARSIGPYSLVTQQPLGGKAQFGGQRFGEMEVWALQAYGAAYTLQEMLTVKSDDVAGRTKAYESIVRGDDTFEIGVPESFNVLIKELKSLGLNVDLKQSSNNS